MLVSTNFGALSAWTSGRFISFLKPSQLPGEYTACAAKYVAHQAKSITRTISAHTGTHLPLGEEKQLLLSVLLKDTSVMTGIRTHTPMNLATRVRCTRSFGSDMTVKQGLIENYKIVAIHSNNKL